jgi:hypothetical protein
MCVRLFEKTGGLVFQTAGFGSHASSQVMPLSERFVVRLDRLSKFQVICIFSTFPIVSAASFCAAVVT